ncbi:MAG: tetratricopeptide repeat protein, partial [Blastocatellia bacterium]
RQCYERALRIDEAAFGSDHPSVASDVNNLGLVLKALGKLDEARQCCERALRIYTAFLGDDHPNTMTTRDNLKSLGQPPSP